MLVAIMIAPDTTGSLPDAHRRRPRWRRAALIAACVLVAATALALFLRESAPGSAAVRPAVQATAVGLTAHPSPLPVAEVAFDDEQGRKHTLAQLRGKSLLVNIWATWCGPCRKEMPALDRLQAKLGGEAFQVVALSVDRGSVAAVRAFYDEVDIRSLTLYVDPTTEALAKLRIVGVPTTVLIDPEGREVARYTGPAPWDTPDMIATIRRLLPLRQP